MTVNNRRRKRENRAKAGEISVRLQVAPFAFNKRVRFTVYVGDTFMRDGSAIHVCILELAGKVSLTWSGLLVPPVFDSWTEDYADGRRGFNPRGH